MAAGDIGSCYQVLLHARHAQSPVLHQLHARSVRVAVKRSLPVDVIPAPATACVLVAEALLIQGNDALDGVIKALKPFATRYAILELTPVTAAVIHDRQWYLQLQHDIHVVLVDSIELLAAFVQQLSRRDLRDVRKRRFLPASTTSEPAVEPAVVQAMYRRLPGLGPARVAQLVAQAPSLSQLAACDADALAPLGKAVARRLTAFLDHDCSQLPG